MDWKPQAVIVLMVANLVLIGFNVLVYTQITKVPEDEVHHYFDSEDEIPVISIEEWEAQVQDGNDTFIDFDIGDIIGISGNITQCSITHIWLNNYDLPNPIGEIIDIGYNATIYIMVINKYDNEIIYPISIAIK